MRRAFTLVELLIVIGIIGLLATIGVTSMSGSKENARVAGAASFDRHLIDALGSGIVAQYDFEEGAGTAVLDASGSNNNATLYGSPAWSTDTFGAGSKYSVNFTGSDYAAPASGFGIAGTNFTMALWVKTTSANQQMYLVANAGSGDGYRFGLSIGRVAFLIGNGSSYTESTCNARTVNDGKWHHIAGVFDRTGAKFLCYVDGQNIGSVALAGFFTGMDDIPPHIGRGLCCQAFVGQLDNVRIYNQNLSGLSINLIYQKEKQKFAALDNDLVFKDEN